MTAVYEVIAERTYRMCRQMFTSAVVYLSFFVFGHINSYWKKNFNEILVKLVKFQESL